jgi:hypothetical protein
MVIGIQKTFFSSNSSLKALFLGFLVYISRRRLVQIGFSDLHAHHRP